MTNRVGLQTPVDIIRSIPYLLGFHPEHSVVLLGLEPDHARVVLGVRVDLDEADAALNAPESGVANALHMTGAANLVAVVFTQAEVEQARTDRLVVEAFTATDALVARTQLECIDRLLVASGRWFSMDCADPRCCGVEGAPIVAEPASGADRAFIDAGMNRPATDRQSLEASFSVDAKALGEVVARLSDMRGLVEDPDTLAADLPQAAQGLTPLRRVAHLLSLTDVHVRDGCAAWVVDTELRHKAAAVWRDLVRCAPDELKAGPATLLALAAWADGNGAVANICLDQALTADPDYSLAWLVRAGLESGWPPSVVTGLLAQAVRPDGRGVSDKSDTTVF